MGADEVTDLPQPPYVVSNIEYLNIIVEFDEQVVRSILRGTGLEPAPTYTGGFMVLEAPDGDRIGPYTSAQAWLDIAGYDSPDGSSGRTSVAGFGSGLFLDIRRRIYGAAMKPGEAWLRTRGSAVIGEVRCNGRRELRIEASVGSAEAAWRTSMHFYVQPHLNGQKELTHIGHSSLSVPAEPVSVKIDAPVGTVLAGMKPTRLVKAIRQTMHLTMGQPVPIGDRGDLAAEPALIYLLSMLNRGALLVNRDRIVIFANSIAERLVGDLLSRSSLLGDSRHRIAAPSLDRILNQVFETTEANKPIALPRHQRNQPLLLVGIQLGPNDVNGRSRRESGSTLVLLIDPEIGEETSAAPSLELLGLTPAEARAATLVGSGLAPREAAQILGNAESTVRVHLERVYQKLEINRQSELAAVVGRVGRLGL